MNTPSLLAFWPFANPLMLLWGAAAAAPIIIHLLSKRRYQEVTWAAMEFLLAAVRKNARRIRLENLLLLLIRTAILVLLTLALADPYLSPLLKLGDGLRTGHTHWVFVVDGSFSMNHRRDDSTLFERAKNLAGRLVTESRQGDGFTLLVMAAPPTTVIAEPAFGRDDVVKELEMLSLRHGGADLTSTLAEVESIVRRAGELHPRLTETRICVFSDLGRTTWDAASRDAVRQRVARLAETARLELFDLGQPDFENRAIAQLSVREPLITPGRDVTIDVQVRQFGGSPSRPRVELLVDGAQVAQSAVDVAPNQPGTATFTHRFPAVGEHTLEARLADDDAAVDNYRWLSVPVRSAVRVLCVQGKSGAARFVSLALQPGRSDRPVVVSETAAETALLERDLSEYDCAFLCNIGRFGQDEADVLRRYVRNGGAVVFFLGDQVQPGNYNRLLAGDGGKPALLPARLGEAVQQQAQYVFHPGEYKHPLIESFRGHEQTGLLTTPIWKYIRLQSPRTNEGAKVALEFDSGDPAIVEWPVGRGRVVLVATAGSTASRIGGDRIQPWTAWPTWPSFPPLVQEMLRLAISDQLKDRNREVGDPLQGFVRSTAADLTMTIEGPQRGDAPPPTPKRSERIALNFDGEDSRWTFSGAYWSGVYQAQFGPPLSQNRNYAVNIDPRESDFSRIDLDDVPSQFQRDYREEDPESTDLPIDKPQPYFRYLLSLMFLLLVAETAVAWRFGNSSA